MAKTPIYAKQIRIIPLGGLDQFGMNCCLLEFDDVLIMVDCGIAFPDASTPGIDYILPDWQWLQQPENINRFVALFVTHGHEDHLGGVPFFLSEFNVPVYTGRLTAEMLRAKLEEHELTGKIRIIEVEPGDIFDFKTFSVEFIHVNHSIPDAMSLAFETAQGYIIFTGDWKLDQTPLYEPPMDLKRFTELGNGGYDYRRKWGAKGVLALLGDSTNALTSSQLSRSELVVRNSLEALIEQAPGRVIIALFSSNIHRIYSIIEIAQRLGKRVGLVGRSLERNFAFALKTGFIPCFDPDLLIAFDEIKDHPLDKTILIMTGTQAEPRSVLPRYAFGAHKEIKPIPSDTVLLSARIIPGNESDIFKMLNQLAKQDVTVITPNEASIHASGHGRREELKLLITLTKPRYVIPMHGDFRIRKAHAKMAREIPSVEEALLINDGDILLFDKHGPRIESTVPHGKVVVDGKTKHDMSEFQLIRDRIKLSSTGIIIAFMVLSHVDGNIVEGPELMQRGFLPRDSDIEGTLQEAAEFAYEVIANEPASARLNRNGIAELLRISVRRYFQAKIARKPLVIPLIHMT